MSDGPAFGRGQFAVDYATRVDLDALRKARVARVQELLAESELAALLVWKDENVRYLTSMRAQILSGKSALLNGCLLVPGHAPILLASGGDLDRARATMPWLEEVHSIPIMEARGLIRGAFETTIAPLLLRLGLDRGRIGTDECSYIQVSEFARALPHASLDDGDTLMQLARRRKFPAELALMEEAAAIAEGVTSAALAAVHPGGREDDVAAEAMHALYRLG